MIGKPEKKKCANGMALFREQGIRFPLPLCAVLLAEIEDELGRNRSRIGNSG